MDPEFIDLAHGALDEVENIEEAVNNDSLKTLQSALKGLIGGLINFVALKISPDNSDGFLLSDIEFSDRKRSLIMEKNKITQQLSQLSPGSEWI